MDHSASGSDALKAYASFRSVLVGWVDLVRAGEMLVEAGGGAYRVRFRGLLSMCGRVLSRTGLVCIYVSCW